jgi:hypothetical protein
LNHEAARDALTAFLEQLDQFHDRRDEERQKRESERLFNQWRSQLLAQEAAEVAKEAPLPFVSSSLQGRRGIFELKDVPDGDPVGERRLVRTKEPQGWRIRGEVEEVRGKELVLYLDREEKSLPGQGQLVLDTYESRIAIERQKQALDALRFDSGGLERSDLRDLILDVIERQGEVLFHGIAVKPGKPTVLGANITGGLIFGVGMLLLGF